MTVRMTIHGTVGMKFVIAVPWCGMWLAIKTRTTTMNNTDRRSRLKKFRKSARS